VWTPAERRFFYLTLEMLARRNASEPSDLTPYELCLYSQNGEDGVVAEILRRIGPGVREFLEFGVESGVEGNCVALADVFGWTGLFIESDADGAARLAAKYRGAPPVRTLRERVTAENVNAVFAQNDVSTEPSVVSVDVDGNDVWIWRTLTHCRPRLVVIEYNAALDFDEAIAQPYDPDWVWPRSDWFGASLGAL
jgi:hypothetical protein